MAMGKKAVIFLFLMAVLPFLASAQEIFTRNLYFGLRRDPEVVKLQEFLRGQGFFKQIISDGNYLWTTSAAVKKFQRIHKIYPASGYFGAKTRMVADSIAVRSGVSAKSAAPVQSATKPDLSAVLKPDVSFYRSKIKISSVSGWSAKPEEEIVYLENISNEEKVDVTSFTLESSRAARLVIPPAHALPGDYRGAPEDRVLVRPGGKVIVNIGSHPKSTNFQNNICTGYFSEESKYAPSLSVLCPRVELSDEISDSCINIINSTPSCRKPNYIMYSRREMDGKCSEFLNKHLSYAGCVADNRYRPDFYKSEWYVWLQRPEEIFRSSRETVILRDREGKEVDRYSY